MISLEQLRPEPPAQLSGTAPLPPVPSLGNKPWAAAGLASAVLAACGGGHTADAAKATAQAQGLRFGAAASSGALLVGAGTGQAGGSDKVQGQALSTTLTADAFLNFLETASPSNFPGPQTTVSAASGGISYVYRAYVLPSGGSNIVAVTSDNKVYALGVFTSGVLTQFGVLSDYACLVSPQNCPAGGAGPANPTEASRFLAQATLGATHAEITALQSNTYAAWVDGQFSAPQSQSHYDWLIAKGYDSATNTSSYIGFDNTIWRKLIAAKDPLRQRVTLALSEIVVASAAGVAIRWRQFAMAAYLDILENNAFGNYRTLLEQVSLSPAMGTYLTYAGNRKANTTTGSQPDENYARELMQLFTIGLQILNPDGTVKLTNGLATETYTQDDVSGMARVWTGWDVDTTGFAANGYGTDSMRRPMVQNASRYETGSKTFLGVTIPAGTTAGESLRIALDTVFNHANTGPFVCKQLIQRLVTSNPSPAYVQRVADTFANNGSGVRGDLKAVVKAILLDTEARDMAKVSDPAFGKLREPVVRFLNWARGFGANSPQEVWSIGDLSDPAVRLGQSPLRSASVFNFFRPGFVPAGSALASQGLLAPEFQITNESSIPGYINYMQRVVAGSSVGDVRADYSSLLALVADSAALLAELNLVLAANQIPAATLDMLKVALDSVSVTTDSGKLNRVYAALVLVLAAPAYIAQK